VTEQRPIQRFQLPRLQTAPEQLVLPEWRGDLNEQQLAAVCAPDGPVLVLAGAGSGKTRVITYRVAFLISVRKVRPQSILLATFTNKAARSMLARAEQVIGSAAHEVTGGTFHHVANLLLRRHGRALGYESNFTILDESDQRSVMKVCRTETGVDTKTKAFPSDRLLTDIASAIVNTNIDLDSLLARRFPHLYDQREEIQRVLIAYHERKRQCNQMDFDDLLVNLLRLLREAPDVRAVLAGRYRHILVDEYQDVNHVQAAIVREMYLGDVASGQWSVASGYPKARVLAKEIDDNDVPPPVYAAVEETAPNNEQLSSAPEPGAGSGLTTGHRPLATAGRGLFIVGDDAQSIYSFRGADYNNIRSFPDAFPDAGVFKLEVNYRSVPQVLHLANCVLDEADPQFRKQLRPVKPAAAERPLLLACGDVQEQAEFVATQAIRLREDSGIPWRQMAVLYRAHNNRLELELLLTQRGIPFVVRGGVRFFEQAHIKDLLCYLVVLANGRDELAWQRMLQMCQRVGPKTIAEVLMKLRRSTDEEGGLLGRFTHNGVADSAKGQAKGSLTALRDFLRTTAEQITLPVSDLIRLVLENRLQSYLEVEYENWRARMEDLEQLIVFSHRFDTLQSFLAEVGLHGGFTGSDILHPDRDIDSEEGALTLSTIHQAKGLEWKVVFVIHVQDDVIPHRMTRTDPEGEDEERRLLYVAITRAEEMLFLSYPQMTETRDFQRLINRPSRFLTGLPTDAYDEAVLDWN
jgi:DNA helicase II / ATP-dependent DNA helicase PcrA